MKTLVIQKLDQRPIPAVFADQAPARMCYQRGDVIDVLPGRHQPSSAEQGQLRWCLIYCNGLTNAQAQAVLFSQPLPGLERAREAYIDLDALGVGMQEGFETIELSTRGLKSATVLKPAPKAHWIIG